MRIYRRVTQISGDIFGESLEGFPQTRLPQRFFLLGDE